MNGTTDLTRDPDRAAALEWFAREIAAAMRDTLPRTAEHEDIEDTMWLDYRKVDLLELLSEEPPVEDRPA